MTKKLLLRSNIVSVCKRECVRYHLSKNYTTVLTCASRTLVRYMQERNEEAYSYEIGEKFRDYIHGLRIRRCANQACRTIDLLNAYQDPENFVFQNPRIPKTFPGDFGLHTKSFFAYLEKEERLRPTTIRMYESILNMFCISMEMSGVTPESITMNDLLDYFSTLQNTKEYVVQCVRCFLRYLQKKEIIHTDLYLDDIHPSKYKREKIPSYYSKDEICRIEATVDRYSVVGKRDYAMMLLASRLGLRSADIRNLKFSDIDWDRNEISIIQTKTQKTVVLPLWEDVGVAIIDYIQNSRPKTKMKEIFVSFRPPYRVITSATLSTMISKHVFMAGIDIKDKHHGAHALRHSLATNLLSNNVSLPTISSILGHSSTESTKSYLTIDLNSLMFCSHDTPMVDVEFYEQKGGVFYVF